MALCGCLATAAALLCVGLVCRRGGGRGGAWTVERRAEESGAGRGGAAQNSLTLVTLA